MIAESTESVAGCNCSVCKELREMEEERRKASILESLKRIEARLSLLEKKGPVAESHLFVEEKEDVLFPAAWVVDRVEELGPKDYKQ